MEKYSNSEEAMKEMSVQFEGTAAAAFRGLTSVGQAIVARAQKILKDKKITTFGHLSISGNTYADKVAQTVDAGFTADHAPFVEFGRKANTYKASEFANLKAWARRKLRIKEKDLDWVTGLIARKIDREGTKAQPFLRPAYEDVQKDIEEIMRKHIKQ